jgi:signal peptidase I
LLVNGVPAQDPGIRKVMECGPSVTGYDYPGYQMPSMPQPPLVANYLGFVNVGETDEVTLPAEPGQRGYMAMGDNSPHSFDSRNWGPVPERNLVGPAFVVYWPFRPHWGLIR